MPVDYKELRCNNWLLENSEDIPVYIQVNGIEYDDGEWLVNDKKYDTDMWRLSELEPIPLDAEILSKAGFTIDRTGAYMVINEFGNIYRLNCVNGEYQSTYNATPIKWLHQLQNHFSANTLFELTINL